MANAKTKPYPASLLKLLASKTAILLKAKTFADIGMTETAQPMWIGAASRVPRSSVPASSLAVPEPGDVHEESNAGRRYKILLAPTPDKHANYARVTVPEIACFVLGDSRDNSIDSRDDAVGFVPLGDILGHVEFIYLPAQTWSRFGPYRD